MTSFDEYVDMYGYHFNKKLYEWAVSMMVSRSGGDMPLMSKEQVTDYLRSNGVSLKNDKGYDAAYVRAMKYADCWDSSITSDTQLALAVSDYLDDPDGYPTKAFDHFVIDCRRKGEPIFWDDML